MDDRWENKISSQGIHYSRYIASYMRELNDAGKPFLRGIFMIWLRKIGLTDEEVREIEFLATNGKLELETSARKFIKDDT